MTEKRLERLESVRRRTGLCTSEIYKGMREHTFPQNFPLSKQAVAWDAAEIDQWIDAKLAIRKNTDATASWQASRFGGRRQYRTKSAKIARDSAERVA
jgi:predicted DNA-binding transcriptional regulator AlpA